MTKIDIFSGFLGAGKTTLIQKLLKEAYKGEQVVLIENEFGEIGIDGGFLKEAGIEIREMNSGCICCSLVGDFGEALKEVIGKYSPDRIIIEPSGVGKLSDVIKAVQKVEDSVDIKLNSFTTLVDVTKCKMYMKNFGEFFSNQIEYAGTIILSRTDTEKATQDKVEAAVELIRSLNKTAAVITTPISQLSGKKILDTMENNTSLEKELMEEILMPHEAMIRIAGSKVVMTGYHAFHGIKAVANAELQQGILRDYLGFDGVMVSDYGSVGQIDSETDALHKAAAALNAGNDVEFQSGVNYPHLQEAIDKISTVLASLPY